MTGRLRLRPAIWAPALAIGLVVVAILSLGVGAVWLSPSEVARALLTPHGPDTIATAVTIVWDLRLARVLLAALVGAGLAGSGLFHSSPRSFTRWPTSTPKFIAACA